MLRDTEFLYEESLYPHVEYAFKHPLTQEVADRSQLKERRAETHAAVARAVEDLSGDRLDEEAALIAHHWEEAGENLAAARRHARAARWIGLRNYTEAFAHWQRVVALIGDTEDSTDAIQLRVEARRTILMLGFRIEVSRSDAGAIFAAAQRDLQRLGDDASLAVLTDAYATVLQNKGAMDEFLALVLEANRIAARSGDRAAQAAVGIDHFYALYTKGRLAESWSVAQDVRERSSGDVSLDTSLMGYSPYVVSYIIPVFTLLEMGRIQEAEACLRRGLELAKEHGPEESRSWANATQVALADARGDRGSGAMNWARLAAEGAERAGSHQARGLAYLFLSVAAVLDRQWDQAIVYAEKAIEIRHLGFCGDFTAQFLATHARALFGAEEVERALDVSAEGIAVAKRQGQPLHQCEATIVHVRCLRALVGADARQTIETLLEEVSQLIEQTGAERWRPHVHVERGELYRLTEDTDAANRELAEAHRLFAEMGATGHAESVAAKIGEEAARKSLRLC
jgi:tetratricopeptide (TPR) repeat protein